MRIGVHNPNQVKVADIFKVNMMVMDVLLEEDDRAVICGTVFIIDHSNVTLSHLVQYSPSFAKKTTTLLQVLGHVWSVDLSLLYRITSSLSSIRHKLLDFVSLRASSELHPSVHCSGSNRGYQIFTSKIYQNLDQNYNDRILGTHDIEKFCMTYRGLCLKMLDVLN
jgi:hypothetical protein